MAAISTERSRIGRAFDHVKAFSSTSPMRSGGKLPVVFPNCSHNTGTAISVRPLPQRQAQTEHPLRHLDVLKAARTGPSADGPVAVRLEVAIG